MTKALHSSYIKTTLGPMIAITDETALYLLEFADQPKLKRKIEKLKTTFNATILPGVTEPIRSIASELESYFEGNLTDFKTPLHIFGSPFQKLVWQALMHIPYGQTQSYMMQAAAIGKDKACRALANANGANQLAVIIPCHRIINNNGNLGGYGGGITRKKWLLEHESAHTLLKNQH